MTTCTPLGSWILIQPSIVRLLGRNAGASGTLTYPLTPSRLNAWPTSPAAKVTPPWSEPLFPPTTSFRLPSAGHHAAGPGIGQPIVEAPTPSLTDTRICPG